MAKTCVCVFQIARVPLVVFAIRGAQSPSGGETQSRGLAYQALEAEDKSLDTAPAACADGG